MQLQRRKSKTRRPRQPKPIPPPKPQRPKRGALREIYKGLISADRDQRVTTLAKAMSWYDQVQAYVAYKQKGQWLREQLKTQDMAQRIRLRGMSSTKPREKEQLYLQAINQYEVMVNGFKPPRIEKYTTVLKEKEEVLEARKIKLSDRFGKFLNLISDALQPKNTEGKRIELRVDKINAAYRIDSEGGITFDRKMLQNCYKTARKQGLLGGVNLLYPVLSEAASRVPMRDQHQYLTGRYDIQWDKRYRAVLEMNNLLNQYALSEQGPNKIVRKHKPKKEVAP